MSQLERGDQFTISHVQGRRNEELIRTLLADGAGRLVDRQDLVLLTDGEASYVTLFSEIFGGNPLGAYRPSRSTHRGRPSCASVSHVRWPMCRLSSTEQAVA